MRFSFFDDWPLSRVFQWLSWLLAIASWHTLAWFTWHCAPLREQNALALLGAVWTMTAIVVSIARV